ncbi:hybrid sensor histidine kinase/response regulator [Gemmata sp.]|uniref:PAS domain-containing hybrid sensor histidine kinase/response regulator n=1 Tax=Gemmata sp. TaxID=1914242 RepID=UPI003F6EE4E6
MAEPKDDQTAMESELFRVLVETTKDYAVFVTDLDGRVVTWNAGAERVLGYAGAEILGESSFVTFTPEDRARGVPGEELRAALRDGRASDDRWHLRKDGTRIWVSGVMVLLRDGAGGPRAFAKVMRDFTGAKLAAESLRESEERLRVALDAAQMGTWLWRIPADEQILDDSLRRLMGLAPGEEVKTLEGFLRAVHGEDRDRVRGEFERCLREGGGFNVEFRVTWPDGTVHWLRDQGRAFPDPGGRPLFMAGAAMDITDRKATEDALRDADRRKDEFLALLAHELRNPLAPVRNGLQVLRRSPDRAVRERSQEMMDRQLSHMVRLIDDLLDVSRITRNKMELRRERVALADVVGSAVETARPAIDAARHDLTVALPAEPVELDADLTRLAQVFGNLLTNSAKYTPPGGRIALSAERHGRTVAVSVRDTGAGIPEESLSRIFDMFSQIDRSLERSTGGLGIGLALVKGLVEMHGGTVAAESPGPGLGCTFTVRLPVLAPAGGAAPGPAPEGPARVTGRRVLVVDDNRDSAESMADMLALFGNELAVAHDGVEAVERAERFRPEVILMDVGMPRLNGLDATRRIREQPWGRGITVIALTGWGQESDRERSRAAGCDGHLTKPVNLPDLEKLLAERAR